MAFIKLHYKGNPIIINAKHIVALDEYREYTQIYFDGGDNTQLVDEKLFEVFSILKGIEENG